MEKICQLCERRLPNAAALREHYIEDHATDDWRVGGRTQRSATEGQSSRAAPSSSSVDDPSKHSHALLGTDQFSQMFQRLGGRTSQRRTTEEEPVQGACALEPAEPPPQSPPPSSPPPTEDPFEPWAGRPMPTHRTVFLAGKIAQFKTAMAQQAMLSTIGGQEIAIERLWDHWLNAQTIPPARKQACLRNIRLLFHYEREASSDFTVRRMFDFGRPEQLTFPSDLDELLPPGTRTAMAIELAFAHRQLLFLLRAILRSDKQQGRVDPDTWTAADGRLGWKEAKSLDYMAEAQRRLNLGLSEPGDSLEDLVAKADRDFVP